MVNMVETLQVDSNDSDSARLRSRWSNDLLAQTFSAGSVDVCQVIRSEKPPPVPLRMEVRCDGFETIRTKRKTITKCIEKIEKAKELLISQMKGSAVSYDAYNETHNAIKTERNEQATFNKMNSIGLLSKSYSGSIQESFSVGSVDVCQVIRSEKPPPVPLRMEVRCDGFETIRTKRKAINRCIKKLEKARKKLLEAEKQSAVSYGDYVSTHDDVRAKRLAKLSQIQNEYLNPKRSASTLGTISEDHDVVSNENQVLNQPLPNKYYEENTETTMPSSHEWTTEASGQKSNEESAVSPQPHYQSLFSSQSSTSYEEVTPLSSYKESRQDNHHLLFDDSCQSVQNDESEIKSKEIGIKDFSPLSELKDITGRQENVLSSPLSLLSPSSRTQDKCSSKNANKSDKYSSSPSGEEIPIVKDMKEYSNDSFRIQNQDQKQKKFDDFSYSIASSIKSMIISDEMLSFSPYSHEMDEIKHKNSHSEMGSTIQTGSAHKTLTNQVIITFSSESNQDHSYQPMNSMYTPEFIDYISIDSNDDEDSKDRYKSTESRASSCERECRFDTAECSEREDRYDTADFREAETEDMIEELQREIHYINDVVHDREENKENSFTDESSVEYIPIGEYDFQSEQYVHYVDAEARKFHYVETDQYHFVDSKYRYSNLDQDDENENVLHKLDNSRGEKNDHQQADYLIGSICVDNLNLAACENEEELGVALDVDVDDGKKRSKKGKKKKTKKKKKKKAFAIEEIVIETP